MATKIDLTGADSLNEANDENLNVVATTNRPTDGTVLNLTGLTVEAFLKASAATADVDGWQGSSDADGVTITDAAAGEFTVNFPHVAVTTAVGFWRADAVDGGGLRKTIAYGAVSVTDL